MNLNKISNRKYLLPIISLVTFFLATAWTLPQLSNSFDFGNLKNKSYYSTLFNRTQQTELSSADEAYLKGKTELIKAEKLYKKADGYQKIAKSSGKSNSKAIRYSKKGVKKSIKAYKYFFNASDIKFHVYAKKLKNIDNNNSKKHLKAEELGIDARATYLEGIDLKDEAKSFSGEAKVTKLEEAFNKHLKAINKQEIAFGIFMNDPEVKYNAAKDEVINNNNTNNNKKANDNKYEPNKDPNIYVSKEESIVAKLNMTSADKSLLDDANDKRTYAETLMKETDNDYVKIDNIRKQTTASNDDYDKNLKNKMASGLEDVLFDKMIKAANMLFDADKTKYKVYAKYLPEARNSTNLKEGRIYEDNSLALNLQAQKTYNKANFYSGHKSNKYIQLMDAVQTELSAIQEQENAFSIYFKQEVTPLNKIVVEHKLGKSNDNSGKKKLTYNYKGSFVYSKEHPTPKTLVHKKGIIFKVQLGLFKNLLSLKQYGKYSPISYDTYKNNPYRRFMLGDYRSYKAAEYVLNKVVTEGLKDPFIVAYENGERKSTAYGMSKVIRTEAFEKIEAEEMNKLTGTTNDIANNKNIDSDNNTNNNLENSENYTAENSSNYEIQNISNVNGLVYSVQLGNFSSVKTANDFKGAEPIYYKDNGSTYKYMSGTFPTYKKAKEQASKLKENGFEGTFIIAYNNGSKVSLDEAKSLVGTKLINNTLNEDKIYFTVQISAYSHKLDEKEMMMYEEITKMYNIDVTKIDGALYIYSIGKYKTYKEAAKVKKDIKNREFDGFVIAFKNGNRISAQEAIKTLKN